MERKNIFSWIMIFLGIFIFIGIILFPHWWAKFFIAGGILDIEFWFNGIRDIVFLLFFGNTVLLIVLLGIIYLIWSKKIVLPKINLFSKKGLGLSGVLVVVLALYLYSYPINIAVTTSSENQEPEQSIDEKSNLLNAPIDFLYLDGTRIQSLYTQIETNIVLKEKTIEQSKSEGAGLETGDNPIIKGRRQKDQSFKSVNQYAPRQKEKENKAIEILNHLQSTNSIIKFETLELSSQNIVTLDEFKRTAEKFTISIDSEKFNETYSRVLKEKLIEEQPKIRSINGFILVQGDFNRYKIDDLPFLVHDYVKIDERNKISFTTTPLQKINIFSYSLRDNHNIGQKLKLNIFGKVRFISSSNNDTTIQYEPYAVW